MKRFALALDLKNDAALIRSYEEWHQHVWPEILESIRTAGILHMEIYRVINRLFMIMETTDDFEFENKAAMDQANTKVQEWETLMWNFQQPLPGSASGEKWKLMEKIFELD